MPAIIGSDYHTYEYYLDAEGNEVRHGRSRTFRSGGQVRSVGRYVHGQPTGEWRSFGPDGSLDQRMEFAPPGKVKKVWVYRDGVLQGTEDHSSGKLVRHGTFHSIFCSHGAFTTYDQGEVVQVRTERYADVSGPPRRGPPTSCVVKKYRHGELVCIETFVDGTLTERKQLTPTERAKESPNPRVQSDAAIEDADDPDAQEENSVE